MTHKQRVLDLFEPQSAIESRFLSKVRPADSCWHWTAAKDRKGYGRFIIGRRVHRAHRVIYEWCAGPIPAHLEIDHLCSNRACVNPAHLEAVTHAENVRRGTTGRYPHGHRTHCDYGHPFDEENTGRRSDGAGRFCRTCRREIGRRHRERRRAAR